MEEALANCTRQAANVIMEGGEDLALLGVTVGLEDEFSEVRIPPCSLIHRSAWKRNSRKSISRNLHSPGPNGPGSP
jgi:hypothetical protein